MGVNLPERISPNRSLIILPSGLQRRLCNLLHEQTPERIFNQCFLRGGGLDNCQFTNVEFEHCNLVEAEFHRTSLKGIDLTSSEIAGIRIGSIPGGELKGATVTSLQALDIARMLGITIKD